jgi:hypothetical protein
MKHGIHEKPAKRTGGLAAVIALLLVVCCAVGGTLAWLVSKNSMTNTFTAGFVNVTIDETLNGDTKSNVKVKVPDGLGSVDAYVRAAIIVNWVDSDGNIYGAVPVPSTTEKSGDYNIDIGDGWTKESDGYYYYKNIVKAGSESNALIKSCAPVATSTAPTGCHLQVTILAEGVQAYDLGETAQQAFTNAKGNSN